MFSLVLMRKSFFINPRNYHSITKKSRLINCHSLFSVGEYKQTWLLLNFAPQSILLVPSFPRMKSGNGLSFLRVWPEKPILLRVGSGSSSIIWDWYKVWTWNFIPVWERVKAKSQNILATAFSVCRRCRRKTVRVLFLPPAPPNAPILNRVKQEICLIENQKSLIDLILTK